MAKTQILLKVSSRGNSGRGMARIRRHIDYISRHGKLAIRDEAGQLWSGNRDLDQLYQDWQFAAKMPEHTKTRQAYNLIISMPENTHPVKLEEVSKKFLDETFDRRYVSVLHTDTPHPHVHVCVLSAPLTREQNRMQMPTKKQLREWRETIAQKMNAEGVPCFATHRSKNGYWSRTDIAQQRLHQQRRGENESERRRAASENNRGVGRSNKFTIDETGTPTLRVAIKSTTSTQRKTRPPSTGTGTEVHEVPRSDVVRDGK